MYFYLGPRPEFHLIKTNEASHFHIYVTLRALTVVVIKSDDENLAPEKIIHFIHINVLQNALKMEK